ncbi:Fe-S protein assembly co-chaperone HscB [Buchnera aphidicola (Ceratovacuna keduensis)]|uniref:Fe-S protein assembly co-chaperone HscB n=1 Tax=Buchnera aphidicola TaxID=9 RepID=UPI0031B82D14
MNYFKMFDIKEEFKINYNKLSKNFHKLQRKFHPDMNIKIFNNKNIKNKSAEINIAYRILKNPIKRVEYIIKINCNKKLYEKNVCNKKFLLYYFEINKKIEKLEKKNKNKIKIKKILEKIKKKQKKYYKKIEIYIKKKKWEKSKNILIKIKFLNKILKKKML